MKVTSPTPGGPLVSETSVPTPLTRVEGRVDRVVLSALAISTLAVCLWAVELAHVNLARISQTGLITALPPGYFVAVGLLSVGFVLTLYRPVPPRTLLTVELACALLMLFGTASIVEPLARFATGWLHAGFTDYVARTGRLQTRLDARFGWPGYFTAAAMLVRAGGLRSAVALLRWAPVYFETLYGIGVFALASTITGSRRAPWLAVWLFFFMNWIGQDYFAPQAFAYVLAIAFIVIVLRCFPGRTELAPTEPRADEMAGARTTSPAAAAGRPALIVVALGIFAAMVVSHQITAPIVMLWTAIVVAARRRSAFTLPLAMLAMFIAWLSFGAATYWTGHLEMLFGPFGNLGRSLRGSLDNRIVGSAGHLLVQEVRLGYTALFLCLGAAAFLRLQRARLASWLVAALALAPFVVLGAQSYGGEVLLRAVLFSIPFLAVLIAQATFARGRALAVPTGVALVALSCTMAPLFVLSRYGNELGDYEAPGTYAALQYLYGHAPAGSTFLSVASEVPWDYRDILKFKLVSPGASALSFGDATRLLAAPGPGAYLVVTQDQVAYGELDENLPPGWGDRIARQLVATGHFRPVYRNSAAEIVARTPLRRGPAR